MNSSTEDIKQLENLFTAELAQAADLTLLQNLRVKYLGKKGEVTLLSKKIAELSDEDKRTFGAAVNELKNRMTEACSAAEAAITRKAEEAAAFSTKIDPGLPGRIRRLGTVHPLTRVTREVCAEFNSMGFVTVEGPEIETDWYNFEALNIGKDHPARDSQDSFYLRPDRLLRTQTSPVQVRVMEKIKPPIAVISPGRVFRRDAVDATHSPIFHQIEGLYVDKSVTFADLKGTLNRFCKRMFGEDTQIRLRPDFFPFTEPSCEISIRYRGRWLEILGAGMVNPAVLKNVGIDPDEFMGFAFGMGVERIAMIKYGIDDIRLFYENDRRFLRQFP